MKRWWWLALLIAAPVHAQEIRVEGGDLVIQVIPDTVHDTTYIEVPVTVPCPECPPQCPEGWTCTPPPEPELDYLVTIDGVEYRDGDTIPTGTAQRFLEDAAGEWRALDLPYNGSRAPGVQTINFADLNGERNNESLWPYGIWNERGNWTAEPGQTYTIIYRITLTDNAGVVEDTIRLHTNPEMPPVPPDTVPVPPDSVPGPGAPDSVTFFPMAPPDTINYWTTGWWDGVPYTAWLKVSPDSLATADLWQAFDPVGNCQFVEGPWVEQFVDVSEVTGSKFLPDLLFFPRYCGPPPEPPDTIAISTPQNLRVQTGAMVEEVAWDRVPEDGQCENSTGYPSNCPDVQGDEIYYRVHDLQIWPEPERLPFDTLSAMASTARSFSTEAPLPDSLKFCVTAEAWDCPTCAGPGGVRSPGNLRGYNPVYYVPVSHKACSSVLTVD